MLPEVFNSLSLRGADWVGLREVSEKLPNMLSETDGPAPMKKA